MSKAASSTTNKDGIANATELHKQGLLSEPEEVCRACLFFVVLPTRIYSARLGAGDACCTATRLPYMKYISMLHQIAGATRFSAKV